MGGKAAAKEPDVEHSGQQHRHENGEHELPPWVGHGDREGDVCQRYSRIGDGDYTAIRARSAKLFVSTIEAYVEDHSAACYLGLRVDVACFQLTATGRVEERANRHGQPGIVV